MVTDPILLNYFSNASSDSGTPSLVPCRICSNTSGNSEYLVQEMMFGLPEAFPYIECGNCGCIQIRTIPEDMTRFYPPHYYSFSENPQRNLKKPLRRLLTRSRNRYYLFHRNVLGMLLSKIRPNVAMQLIGEVGLSPTSKILDVGCGSGELLYSLREAGFRNLLGIDPFLQEDISYGNGLLVKKGSLSEVTGTWDLVMFHLSFEHLANPGETLHF